jgi:hypothetical protein
MSGEQLPAFKARKRLQAGGNMRMPGQLGLKPASSSWSDSQRHHLYHHHHHLSGHLAVPCRCKRLMCGATQQHQAMHCLLRWRLIAQLQIHLQPRLLLTTGTVALIPSRGRCVVQSTPLSVTLVERAACFAQAAMHHAHTGVLRHSQAYVSCDGMSQQPSTMHSSKAAMKRAHQDCQAHLVVATASGMHCC